MRQAFISLIFGLLFIVAHAESIDEEILPSDRNHLTIHISYDAALPGKWKVGDSSFKMFRPGNGVSFGADYMFLLSHNLFFEPGAQIFIDDYSYNNITIGEGTPENPAKTYDPPVRKTGLRIPLTAGYKFDIFKRGSLFLATGPEPTFGFSALTKVDYDQKDIFEENMYKTLMRRYDIAWDIRAAVIIENFRVHLTGAFGLLDVIKTDVRMHENRFSVGLGYVF